MKWFNNLNYIFKYLICMSLLFLSVFLARLSFYKEIKLEEPIDISVTKTNIYSEDENFIVDVYYPKFKDADFWVILGDLNFRINMSYDNAMSLISEKNYKDL